MVPVTNLENNTEGFEMNSALLAGDPHPCVGLTTSKILWNPDLHVIKEPLTSKKEGKEFEDTNKRNVDD